LAQNHVGKKNMRIKDIAKAAGVSVGTVDRVLHNRGKVSEDALKKVMEVLNKNEYKPNLIARMLGSNRSYRIVVLLPNPTRILTGQSQALASRRRKPSGFIMVFK